VSEFDFLSGRGRLSPAARRRIASVARRHGCAFTNVELPGEGWRYWFSGPNRGDPFDRAIAIAVREDLASAGIDLDMLAS
jgi:hypothetical protein